MSDPVSNLLSRLNKVRERKPSSWEACCPAHDDRSPSLSITEKDNKILLKCFSGCSTEEITNALGLELKDLFTDSGLSPQERKQYKKQKTLKEYLQLFDHELMVICQAVNTRLYTEQTLSEQDQARERLSATRIINLIGHLYD